MSISEDDKPDQINAVWCTDSNLVVKLIDDREISVPLWWYPRLLGATAAQRANADSGRYGIHWAAIDEDIELAGLLEGARAPNATPPIPAETRP